MTKFKNLPFGMREVPTTRKWAVTLPFHQVGSERIAPTMAPDGRIGVAGVDADGQHVIGVYVLDQAA